MGLKVELTRRAYKDLGRVSPKDQQKILKALDTIATDPFQGDIKKIRGMKGIYRRRIGDYRLFFSIDKSRGIVTVYNISHRGRIK